MWLPSSLRSCWQTKDNTRTIGNTPCPFQPSVHHGEKILISGITVVVVELNKQVVKFVAIFCKYNNVITNWYFISTFIPRSCNPSKTDLTFHVLSANDSNFILYFRNKSSGRRGGSLFILSKHFHSLASVFVISIRLWFQLVICQYSSQLTPKRFLNDNAHVTLI